MLRRHRLALTLAAGLSALTLGPPVATAQSGAATLVADSVQLGSDRTLIARGNVEVLQGGARLRATSITYDRTNGSLQIAGPITLTDDDKTVVLADAAQLSDDLRQGILTSARIVMDRQLQIAAAEMQRLGGRHTVLNKAVASSCQVCAEDPTPLWEIRARRVIHDQQERQIYFDGAQVRIAGVPLLWLPHLRMPDPTLDRTSGFLMPRMASSSRLGVGLHIPYFVTLGTSRDLTVTPFATTKGAASLGLRYRQAFRHGQLELSGALGRGGGTTGRRGWLGAQGRFDLGRGFGLTFSGEMISDPAYFRDFGLPDKDRLNSQLVVSRTRANEHVSARLVHTHSIRTGEVNSELPQLSGDLLWTRRLVVPGIGGIATLAAEAHGHRRSSKVNVVGRDVVRSGVSAHWRRDWLGPMGLLATVETGVSVDLHRIRQDSSQPEWARPVSTVIPVAMIELRWPWARVDGRGNSDVLEPVIQLVHSRATRFNHVPNEDSVLVEFDEGNLFGLSRFSGVDRREGGTRVNAGLQWNRSTTSGWQIAASAGRVFRLNNTAQFTPASGLAGRRSDWIAALHLATPLGTAFQGRVVFDDRLDFARGEMRLAVERERFGLAAGWLWAERDLAENRTTDTAEWVFDGRLKLSPGWTARAAGRHDFGTRRTTAAGVGLEFLNECLRVDVSMTRRFTSSPTVPASTDFGFSVDFLGFGGARAVSGPSGKTCRY